MNFPPPCDKNDPKSRCNRTKKIGKQIGTVLSAGVIVGILGLEANRYIQKNKLGKGTFLENSYLEYKKDGSKIQDIVTSNDNIDDNDTTKITHSLREELHENMISDYMIDEFISRYADVITSEEALKSQDIIGTAKERGLDDLMYANLQPSKASISPTQINKKDIDIPGEFFSLMQSQQPENFKLFVHSVSQRKIKTPTGYEQLYKILGYDDTQKCESDIKNGKIALSENQGEYSRAFSAIYLKYLLNQEYNKFLEQGKSGEYEPKDVQKMYNDYYIKYRKVLDKHNKDLTGMANSQGLYPKIIDNIEHPYTQACEVYSEGKNICDQIIDGYETKTINKKITKLLDQLEKEGHIHIPIKTIKQKIQVSSKSKKIVKGKVQKSETVSKKVKDYSNKGVLVQVKNYVATLSQPELQKFVSGVLQQNRLTNNIHNTAFVEKVQNMQSIEDIQAIKDRSNTLNTKTESDYRKITGLSFELFQDMYEHTIKTSGLRAASNRPINTLKAQKSMKIQQITNVAIAAHHINHDDFEVLRVDGDFGPQSQQIANKLHTLQDTNHVAMDLLISDIHSIVYNFGGYTQPQQTRFINDMSQISPGAFVMSINALTDYMKQNKIDKIIVDSLTYTFQDINGFTKDRLDTRNKQSLVKLKKILTTTACSTLNDEKGLWVAYLGPRILAQLPMIFELGIVTPDVYTPGSRGSNTANTLTRTQQGLEQINGKDNVLAAYITGPNSYRLGKIKPELTHTIDAIKKGRSFR